jgi:hypothetical protein
MTSIFQNVSGSGIRVGGCLRVSSPGLPVAWGSTSARQDSVDTWASFEQMDVSNPFRIVPGWVAHRTTNQCAGWVSNNSNRKKITNMPVAE